MEMNKSDPLIFREGREGCKKRKLEDGQEVTEMFLPFVRGHFGDNESCRLPKTLLLVYCRSTALFPQTHSSILVSVYFRQNGLEQPKYMMETVDKQFRASVKVGKVLFDASTV